MSGLPTEQKLNDLGLEYTIAEVRNAKAKAT